ncbi:hypothetical protein SO802_002235 [Lithocarpus litseifolius]|uniref:Replication factor A C-terminal domain-containing protein n=1 Tax=Lithocarpus litseifolius TaxID=425828 RepID=A0AAW2E208_9ROSI
MTIDIPLFPHLSRKVLLHQTISISKPMSLVVAHWCSVYAGRSPGYSAGEPRLMCFHFCLDYLIRFILIAFSSLFSSIRIRVKGEYNLSSTSGTRVYIDLDIPETAEFKDQYRIQLKVEDSSGMATFILFDSEAKKLLNISTKDLLNKSLEEPDEVILPVQIENLKGKQFVFQIQLNDYNLKYGWEFYIVKKLFDTFEETDKAIQLDKMTEAYISDTSNECSNNLPTEEDGDCTKFHKLDN